MNQNSNQYREQLRKELNRLGGNEYRQKIAEAINLLGEVKNCNENGVYLNYEVLEIPLSKRLKTSIKIELSEGNDGLWRYGFNYLSTYKGYEGGGCHPFITDFGHKTKDTVICAAIEYFKSKPFLTSYMQDFQNQYAEVKCKGDQLLLF